ncbi:MAG: HlyD family efflux transporter periplasmic adaptor subunit [Oscillospiraceae bacterium]
MNENGTKRREWVKNAAIIFLAVMLVLTFFSNTIMNYSLPEVSAQYVGSGTLSEQIRGSGTVEANQTYDVKIDETRTIASVDVKVGDEVQKGQTIITLEDSESSELIEAQKTLDSLKLEYEKALLANGVDYSLDNLSIKNKEEDIALAKEELSKLSYYKDEYDKAKDDVTDYEAKVNAINDSLTALASEDYASLDESYYNRITSAKNNLDAKEQSKAKTEEKIKEYESEIASGGNQESISAAKKAVDNKLLEISQTEASINEEYLKDEPNIETINSLKKTLEQLNLDLTHLQDDYSRELSKSSTYNRNKQLLNAEKTTLNINQKEYDSAKKKFDDTLAAIKLELKTKLTDLQEKLEDAKKQEAELQSKASKTVEEAESEIRSMERELEQMKLTLSQKQQEDAEAAGTAALDLKAKQDAISDQEKVVEKLSSKSVGAKITAQVSGKITELPFVAGEEAAQGSSVAKIEMTEKGYTLEMTVTVEQAKKVKVGDEAEIQYFWYGDASAVLQSIAPDTANPAKNKILKFAVTGDVTPGQTLQLSMGSKGQNYETIVPNSAIREDNNGKFVLAVVAKSSPLGNRYIAQRVDIEVLASDDKSSAVSGAFYESTFIITTSTKPIEAGMQVRLVES